MKNILIFLLLSLSVVTYGQTNQTPEQIRQRMSEIRRTTNWDDPAAAKKANEEIRDLSKQLMSGGNQQFGTGTGSGSGSGNQGGQDSSDDGEEMAEISQDMAQQKMDIFSQIWKAAAGGEGADILLAEPLREEIVNEYKEEDSPQSIPFVAEELEVLVIDVSMKGIQAVIDNMPLYKSIKTLVITNSTSPVPADLNSILKNAADYPLKELYIVNLGVYVKTLPREISQFRNLVTLGIFSNWISTLPDNIASLTNLKNLYADNNPLTTTFPVINGLPQLEELGIINTKVPESEISRIREMYPSCKIIVK